MMPTMPPDNNKITLKIIEAIRAHPVLYISDIKGPAIKLQEFRQKVWKRISDELGLEPSFVRTKWKNLRDTYSRILKHRNKRNKGTRRKPWTFEEQLSFLKYSYGPDCQPQYIELSNEYIEEMDSTGMNSGVNNSDTLLEQLDEKNDQDYSEFLEVLDDTADDTILPDDDHIIEATIDGNIYQLHTHDNSNNENNINIDINNVIQNKYVKINEKRLKLDYDNSQVIETNEINQNNSSVNNAIVIDTQISNDIIDNNLNNDNTKIIVHDDSSGSSSMNNSIELFFSSMAQTVKSLPSKAQIEAKLNVCRIVSAAEAKYSRKKTTITQRIIAPPGMIPKLVLIPCSMIDNPSANS